MSAPVHSLTADHTLQDAALLMSRHAMRHVPVPAQGRVVNIVSERDLSSMQRMSIKQLKPDFRGLVSLARQRRWLRG
jgi:CBS domain-containing protein